MSYHILHTIQEDHGACLEPYLYLPFTTCCLTNLHSIDWISAIANPDLHDADGQQVVTLSSPNGTQSAVQASRGPI